MTSSPLQPVHWPAVANLQPGFSTINIGNVPLIDPEGGIAIEGQEGKLRPFSVANHAGETAIAALNAAGDGSLYVPLGALPGIRFDGKLSSTGRPIVSFGYYKHGEAGRHRQGELLGFAHGILPDAGHEGEAPTWYLQVEQAAYVDGQTGEQLSELEGSRFFSAARILGELIGDPRRPDFRQRMGIQHVATIPDII